MKSAHIGAIVLGLALVGGGAFYGGTLYAKSSTGGGAGSGRTGAPGGRGTFQFTGGPGGRGGMNFTNGEVVTKDDTSLTLKMMDGGSKVVFLSASTTVSKMTTGTLDDVSEGTNVSVNGTMNSDGSITASMIQLRPAIIREFGAGASSTVPTSAQ